LSGSVGISVLHIAKHAYVREGGIERHVTTLLPGLVQRGVDVTALVYGDVSSPSQMKVNGVNVELVQPTLSVGSQPIALTMFNTARKLHSNKHFDIVHVHCPDVFAHAVTSVFRNNRPKLIATWHSDIVRQRFIGPLYLNTAPYLLPQWDAVIAATHTHLLSTQIPSYLPETSRYVVPYGVAEDQFQITPQVTEKIRALRFSINNAPLVFALGRHVRYKGLHNLIEAIREVPGKLIIGGEGPATPQLQALVRNLGLDDKVRFLGHLDTDNLRAAYHACDVFCLPSISPAEAFGLVQVEAMLCSKPVVNTKLGTGVNEVCVDGVTGKTVEPNQPAQLSQALNQLLTNPELSRLMGEAGRRRAIEMYNCDSMLNGTLGVYKSVLLS
jgi:glycosyltransferase involved in cell wall biosynthesis